MKHYRYLVYTNPVDGCEAEYNHWYDTVHLREVLTVPGFLAAERYRCQPLDGVEPEHDYLAVYEFEAEDPAMVLTDLATRAYNGSMDMPPLLADGIKTVLYEVLTPRLTRQ